MQSFHRSKVLLIRPYWGTQLLYFMPLLIFIGAIRPLLYFGGRIDWQIYYWGLLFFILLAIHGASRPILRITANQLIFYQTQKRFWFCSWQDVTQVQRVKRSLKFTTINGQEMMSPPLGRRQRQQLLGIIAFHQIPTVF
jgi:hypothetical protein